MIQTEKRDETGANDGFDASRAALFDSLSHPNRVKILSALNSEPMSFAELKRRVGIESSGHLSFHLAKLKDLTKTTPDGKYALNDDGREALHIAHTMIQNTGASSGKATQRNAVKRYVSPKIILYAAFLIALVSLSIVARMIYQQNLGLHARVEQLNNKIAADDTWISSLNGQVSVWKALASRLNFTAILRQFTVTLPTNASRTVVASFTAGYGGYVLINGTSNAPWWWVGIRYYSAQRNMTYEDLANLSVSGFLWPIPQHVDPGTHTPLIISIEEENGSWPPSNKTATIDVTYFFMPVVTY